MLNTLLLLLLAFIPCQAQYPFLRWSSNVLGQRGLVNGGFRKGNGVVLSKNQGELWATDALGSLHVIHLHENRDHVVFTPNSLSGRATESRSSVALFEGGEISFAIYTVLDVPLDVNDAVQRNSLLWTTTLLGSIIGNAQISSDGTNVVVLHNFQGQGVVTVLSVEDNGSLLFQKESSFFTPFSPPKLATVDGLDTVYWGESTDDGYADTGIIFHMDVDEPFKVVTDFLADSSTGVQPTVSADGSTLWLGGKEAHVYSWNLSGERGRAWTKQLAISKRNATAPLLTQIEASGSKLFVASATNSFHCLNAEDGSVVWSSSFGPSIYLSSAKYSEENDVVYSIQHLTGKIVQHNANTGEVMWHYDCVNITSSSICMDSVEAESSLSQDGTTLYYGDIYGTVYALAVSAEPPTDAPTHNPSSLPTDEPSRLPSSAPSLLPSAIPTLVPSSVPSLLPSSRPSFVPSSHPSSAPSAFPTISPSAPPSTVHSTSPSVLPSINPTLAPSAIPTIVSSRGPSGGPSESPSLAPSNQPSAEPSPTPSAAPTAIQFSDKSLDFQAATEKSAATKCGASLVVLLIGAFCL